MTSIVDSLQRILAQFDVAVLDQWGVLHDGSAPYPHAVSAMQNLHDAGKQIVVLSNSGKRADLNRERIENIGLPANLVSQVVTSGEALWDDLNADRVAIAGKRPCKLYPICDLRDDPIRWVGDSANVEITFELNDSVDAIMLMGLPDGTASDAYDAIFRDALDLKLPLICSNPDKTSPRAGELVISPGALADRFARMGGQVMWYGKPDAAVYQSVLRSYPDASPSRFLMVGDSLEHDIAGAKNVGFVTAFVRGGIHAPAFEQVSDEDEIISVIERLSQAAGIDPPDYSLRWFR